METIDINEVFAQASAVENLKNFAGIDAQNALSMMTPERLAAVVGEKAGILSRKIDLRINSKSTSDLGIRFGLIQVWSEYISSEKALLYFYSGTKCNEIQPAVLINNSQGAKLRIFKESESGNILIQNNSIAFAVVHVEVIV